MWLLSYRTTVVIRERLNRSPSDRRWPGRPCVLSVIQHNQGVAVSKGSRIN
jgi:hypothetical protein